jgi:DNA-3-methyladenine glycosylase I
VNLAERRPSIDTALVPPEVRYARSGDVSIAYSVVGDGPFDLVWTPGALSHLDITWEDELQARFFRELASFSRLIMFDKRGTGLSDRVPGIADLETRMDDIRAVMDDAGSESAAVCGVSEGGPMALLFAATYPERVRALVNYGSLPRFVRGPNFPWREPKHEYLADYAADAEAWGSEEVAREWLESQGMDTSPEAVQERARRDRMLISPGAYVQLGQMNAEIDVRPVLPMIRVPTLVLHRADDHIPIEGARWMAEQIPGARFRELPNGPHMPFVGDWESVVAAIREFVEPICLESAQPYDSVLATVLFTDLVGSTAKAVELGDRGWRELLEQHHARTRAQLSRYRGIELDTAGDGFFAPLRRPRTGDPLRVLDPRRRHRPRPRGTSRAAHGRVRGPRRKGRRSRRVDRRARGCAGRAGRGARLPDREGSRGRVRDRVRGSRRGRAQRASGRVEALRGGGRHMTEPIRCWTTSDPAYNAYHDDEWGRPVLDERGLYERLCLEGFQSGLAWITILRKREAFRRGFAGFDPERVARFGERDVERLLGDAGIVRHRGKIEAAIANARATLALREAGTPLDKLMWEYRDAADGKELSKGLKAAGFRFVGPTTVYSSLEACGIINGHIVECWVHDAVEAERDAV